MTNPHPMGIVAGHRPQHRVLGDDGDEGDRPVEVELPRYRPRPPVTEAPSRGAAGVRSRVTDGSAGSGSTGDDTASSAGGARQPAGSATARGATSATPAAGGR